MTKDDRPKFTPGPWRMPPCCTIHMDKPSWDETYSPLVKSGREAVYGLVNVRVADAALIAAAPEMYEALEEAVEFACEDCEESTTGNCNEHVCPLVWGWKHLLAKARGEGEGDE